MVLKRMIWPIIAMLAVFGMGFVLAFSMRQDPTRVEVVTRAGPSAAASISLVMFGILAVMILGAILAVVAGLVIRARRQAQRLEQMALLFGARQPQPQPRQRRMGPGDGPSVVIISGGRQGAPLVEDMRDGYG